MGVVKKEKHLTQRSAEAQRTQRREDAGLKPGAAKKPQELNAVGNGGLHAIEEEDAAEKNENDGGCGNEQQWAGGLPASRDGPAEAVNNAGHGIEVIEPAPARGYKRGSVGHGRSEHPERNHERDDVANVAIERVERGEPQADAESREEREQEKDKKPEGRECWKNVVGQDENGKHHQADGKVHQPGENGRNGENEAREINLGDELLAFYDDVGGRSEGRSEIGPGNKRGEIKNGIRKAVGRKFGEAPEEKSENEHVEDWLQDDPEDADGSLLVADLDVAPNKEIEQLAVGPDFTQAQLKEAAGRLDADGSGGAGARCKGSGLWRCRERSHALR